MELNKAKALCLELMTKHGLTLATGWKFEWIRSHNTAGRCANTYNRLLQKYTGGTISLSTFVTQHHDEAKVTDTILHEIAHALTPGHGHDYVWVRKAIEIGCNGQRCYDVNDSAELTAAREKTSKVVGTCPKCQEKFFMTRMPKRDQWCRCQRRPLRQEYKIQWVINGNTVPTVIPTKPQETKPIFTSTNNTNNMAQYPTVNAPIDSYGKMLQKFMGEIKAYIPEAELKSMANGIEKKSWRFVNREMRKACNQYCADNDIMSLADFQAKWFYEGTMIGRTTWGKDAPWEKGTTTVKAAAKTTITKEVKKTSPAPKTATKKVDMADTVRVNTVQPSKTKHKTLEELFNEGDPWAVINYPIQKRIEAEMEEA